MDSTTTVKDRKVLLVEDDRSVARMLRFSLRDAGFDVNAVETGAQALEALSREPISAVVLDLGLPDGRGGDVLELLKRQDKEGAPQRPVWVVITAQEQQEVLKRHGPLGEHFLAKPFDPWDLVRRLQTLLPGS